MERYVQSMIYARSYLLIVMLTIVHADYPHLN